MSRHEAHVEREFKLSVPPRFRLPAVGSTLDGLRVSRVRTRRLTTVYYDTPDLTLTRWGCSLRYRRGEGWTVKLAGSGRNDLWSRPEFNFDGPALKPPAEALDLVSAYLRGRSPVPVALLRTVRTSVRLADATGREVAEVAHDDVRVLHDGRVAERFRELEIEVARGVSSHIVEPLVNRLREAGAGAVPIAAKSVRALGAPALEPPEIVPPAVSPESTTEEVVRYALADPVAKLLHCDAPLRAAMDPESVHQARVATRRLRSALRTFLPILDETWAAGLRDTIAWLADELGAVRDADILVARVRRAAVHLDEANAQPVSAVIRHFARAAAEARRRLSATLHDPRYIALLEELVQAATQPRIIAHGSEPAAAIVPPLVDEPWKKLRKAVEDAGDDPDDEHLHRIRIKAKHCRYAAEAVAAVVGKPMLRFARRLAKLQRILGEVHDAVVVQETLRQLRGTRETVFVAGELAALEMLAANEARAGWRKAWKKVVKRAP
jgi:CHAD domain-containing protein